jgi:hypothetical protein
MENRHVRPLQIVILPLPLPTSVGHGVQHPVYSIHLKLVTILI